MVFVCYSSEILMCIMIKYSRMNNDYLINLIKREIKVENIWDFIFKKIACVEKTVNLI